MRTRSRTHTPTSNFSTFSKRYTAYIGPIDGTSTHVMQDSETMTDRKTPGYFKAEREGTIKPVSPMSKRKELHTYQPASFSQVRAYSAGEWWQEAIDGYGFLCPPEALEPITGSEAELPNIQVYLQEALAYAQTNAWDTATFLAEFNKTVEALSSFRARWEEQIRRVFNRSKHPKYRLLSAADAIASAHLELRYSFRPLYYDMLNIEEAVNRLKEGVENPLSRGWATGVASPVTNVRVTPASTVTALLRSPYNIPNLFQAGMQSAGSVGSFASTSYISTAKVRTTVGVQVTTREVTLADPLLTAWELIPFSFVFDWFITIGDMISAFSPFATGTFKFATRTIERSLIQRVDFHPVEGPLTGTFNKKISFTASPGFYQKEIVTIDRAPATVEPTLNLRLNLDVAKVFDLVALMWTLKLRYLKFLR